MIRIVTWVFVIIMTIAMIGIIIVGVKDNNAVILIKRNDSNNNSNNHIPKP